VFTTEGGSCYHRTPSCKLLIEGQPYAERLGLNVHDPVPTPLRIAESNGHVTCSHCFSLPPLR